MTPETSSFVSDILIVDDKLENIRFLSDFLSEHQYQIRKAISGQSALTAVKTLPPDLILLDINMPGMGGYEVCEQLKKDPKTHSIPVIFLSAGSELDDKVQAFQVGGVDYITKPFQLEEVLIRVQTQLTIKNLQKDLETRNDQLQAMVLALQNTQTELIQKEKIISASRISAGISHEVNNGLNIVLGNLGSAAHYSQTLATLIHLYQKTLPEPPLEVTEFLEDIDLDFLVTDFTKVIHSIRKGAERIHFVVRALHIFSHLKESSIQQIDVHESIESVLTTLHPQLMSEEGLANIVISKDYGELPSCLGHANLFNQVFLNLLQNSIDAIQSRMNSTNNREFEPRIWITTSTTNQGKIQINIRDNGVGIPLENKPHLFDPFFTTKPIEQGVGLSLFTTHQIITELHKGHLSFQDNQPEGAEFVIEFPVH